MSTTTNINLFDELNLDETICDCDFLSERTEERPYPNTIGTSGPLHGIRVLDLGTVPPINQRGEMISDSLIPFHKQAEDEGSYVLADRAREAAFARPEELPEGPSENTD